MHVVPMALVAAVSFAPGPLPQDEAPKPPPAAVQAEDFPALVRPYLKAAEGLEGHERSLTIQIASTVGMAKEREALDPSLKRTATDARRNLNYLLRESLPATAGLPAGSLLGGGLFYDTGVQIASDDPEAFALERSPEFRMQAVEDIEAVLERRRLVAGLKSGLTEPRAEALMALLQPLLEGAEGPDAPWLHHAYSQASFHAQGLFEDYVRRMRDAEDQVLPFEEFQACTIAAASRALVDPLRAELPEEIRKQRSFRFEADYVLQVVDPDQATEAGDWPVPEALLEANRGDRSPILIVQVPPRPEANHKSKWRDATLGVIAGGEHRVIHRGRLPIR